MARKRSARWLDEQEVVAGNGLLHRRMFLSAGAAMASAMAGYALSDSADAAPLPVEPWMKTPTSEGFSIPNHLYSVGVTKLRIEQF